MYNICLKIAYKGSNYLGSQKQKNAETTVQGVLEQAIKKLFVIDEVKH